MGRLGIASPGLWLGPHPVGTISPSIQRSASNFSEATSSGTTVATLSVINHPSGSSGWTFAETADPDNKFNPTITAGALKTNAAVDYNTKASHSITITASKSGQTDIVQTFVFNVLAVLGNLALSSYAYVPGVPSSGSITGAHDANSVISLSGGPAGLTLNSAARTFDFDGSASDSTGGLTLRETHPQATVPYKDTGPLAWTVSSASAAAAVLWTPANATAGTFKLWYDPADAATVTQSGGLISALADKSGNGFGLASSGSLRPGWDYANMAQEAMGFDRVDDVMTSVSSAITQNQPTVLYQVSWPVGGGGINETGFDGSGTLLWRPNQGGNSMLFAGTPYFPAAPTIQVSQQIMARYSGSTGYYSKDAGTELSGSIGSGVINGTVRLGSSATNDAPYGGYLGETLLSAADITTGSTLDKQTRGYLAWRWGTWESLPSNYDFRYAAPKVGVTPAAPAVSPAYTTFIPHGSSGAYHATNIFDPCIVDHPSDPTKLIMYASGQAEPPGSGVASIGRWIIDKTSPLSTPTLSGVVLTTGGPAWNNEAGGVRLGSVILVSGTYYMYFCTQQTGTAIGVATSTDSINFTIQTTQLLVPSGDETQIGEPAIWWEGGVATIIYDYRTGGTGSAVLPGYRYATASSLLGPFTKGGGQDILRRPRLGLQIEAHQIIKRNGRYYLLCEVGGNPTDATPYRLYLASCATLTGRYQWEKLILAEAAGAVAPFHVATPGLFTVNGTDYLYYTAAPDFAQPYGENRWNMDAGAITGLFDTTSGGTSSKLLMETSDKLLLETSDFILLEA